MNNFESLARVFWHQAIIIECVQLCIMRLQMRLAHEISVELHNTYCDIVSS